MINQESEERLSASKLDQDALIPGTAPMYSPDPVPQITFVDAPQPLSTDDLPIRRTSLDLIDVDKVTAHIAAAIARGRYTGPPDPIAYLIHKKCIVVAQDTYYATRAGILCFGRQPQALMPRAVVDLGHYRGLGQLSFDVVHLEKDINGTLFEQMARVESYLTTNTHHGMTVAPGSFQRVEIHEYPPIVVRELCANMLAHRDYEHANSASRVMLFRDRIEWATPGGLPPNVTVENLLDAQYSRNPVILSIFFEAGYVEAFGQGLDTVFAVLKTEDMEPPYFRNTGESFVAGVYGRPLQIFASDSTLPVLNEYQRKILGFIRQKGEVAPGDLKDLLPARAPRSLGRDTKGLVDADLIEATGGSKAIRYRLRRQ